MSFSTRPPITGISGGLKPRGISTFSTPPIVGGKVPTGGVGGFLNSPVGGLAQGLLGSLLGDLEIGKNIKLVKEYGLSSWNASTSPEEEMKAVSEFIVPIITDKLQQINDSNVGQILTWIDGFIMFTYTAHKHLREHHSRAGATKVAHDKVMQFCLEMRKKSVKTIANELKSSSFKVAATPRKQDFNVLDNDVYSSYHGKPFDSHHKYYVTSDVFHVSAPVVKTVSSDSPADDVKTTTGINSNQNTNPSSSSGGTDLLGLALKGVGVYLASKLLKF